MRFKRYHLAWFDAAGVSPGPDEALLKDWATRGRPAIIRRRQAGESGDHLSLAVTLPNASGRRRIAFTVAEEKVRQIAPPPLLQETLACAPPEWAENWPHALGAHAHVHGGLMWQYLTGEAYLRLGSDVDLLLWIETVSALDEAMAAFDVVKDRREPRVDGELIFPDGGAVPWREWLSDAKSVLVKGDEGAAFVEREAILDMISRAERSDALPPA